MCKARQVWQVPRRGVDLELVFVTLLTWVLTLVERGRAEGVFLILESLEMVEGAWSWPLVLKA